MQFVINLASWALSPLVVSCRHGGNAISGRNNLHVGEKSTARREKMMPADGNSTASLPTAYKLPRPRSPRDCALLAVVSILGG